MFIWAKVSTNTNDVYIYASFGLLSIFRLLESKYSQMCYKPSIFFEECNFSY